jgi:hypothetical protein
VRGDGRLVDWRLEEEEEGDDEREKKRRIGLILG